jgi:hypothetical protein
VHLIIDVELGDWLLGMFNPQPAERKDQTLAHLPAGWQ